MRVSIKPSSSQNIAAVEVCNFYLSHTVLLQVLDPVTVFFATSETELTRELDPAGNSTSGFELTQGAPFLLVDFSGKLFATCNIATKIQVSAWRKLL